MHKILTYVIDENQISRLRGTSDLTDGSVVQIFWLPNGPYCAVFFTYDPFA